MKGKIFLAIIALSFFSTTLFAANNAICGKLDTLQHLKEYKQIITLSDKSLHTVTNDSIKIEIILYRIYAEIRLEHFTRAKEQISEVREQIIQSGREESHQFYELYYHEADIEYSKENYNTSDSIYTNLISKIENKTEEKFKILYMNSLTHKAFALQKCGESEKGMEIIDKAVEFAKASFPKSKKEYLTLQSKMEYCITINEFDDAEDIYETLEKKYDKLFGKTSIEYGILMSKGSWLYRDLGKFNKAEALINSAETIIKSCVGDSSLLYSDILQKKMFFYYRVEKNSLAFYINQKAYSILLDKLEPQHSSVFYNKINEINIVISKKDFKQAEEKMDLLENEISNYGEVSFLLKKLMTLTRVRYYNHTENYEKSLLLLNELTTFQLKNKSDSLNMVEYLIIRGVSLIHMSTQKDKKDESKVELAEINKKVNELAKQLIFKKRSFFGGSNSIKPAFYSSFFFIAKFNSFYAKYLDDIELAVKIANDALKRSKDIYGENHPRTYDSYTNLFDVTNSKSNKIELCKKRVKIAENLYGDRGPTTLVSKADLANEYMKNSHNVDAEKTYKEILSFQKVQYGEASRQVYKTLFELGYVCYKMNKLDDAQNYTLQSLNIADSIEQRSLQLKTECHILLAYIYKFQNDLERSKTMFEQSFLNKDDFGRFLNVNDAYVSYSEVCGKLGLTSLEENFLEKAYPYLYAKKRDYTVLQIDKLLGQTKILYDKYKRENNIDEYEKYSEYIKTLQIQKFKMMPPPDIDAQKFAGGPEIDCISILGDACLFSLKSGLKR